MAGMAGRTPHVFLHIGAMKTGTSYLQQLLTENKDALGADGVLFPGKAGWGEQVRGVREVLLLNPDKEMRARTQGAWDRVLAEITEHDGHAALLSMEFMSFAREPGARRLVESLAPADVHVILTVRDSGRVMPAHWQESTQNRRTISWREYAEAVVQGPDSATEPNIWRSSMKALNIPAILSVWAPLVPSERLHVVLVPPPGSPSTLLWERFAAAVGLEASRYAPPGQGRNQSLGYASADLMRRVNAGLGGLSVSTYNRTVKSYLCKQVLAGRAGEPKMPVTRPLADFAARWNASMATAITGSGAKVHGDLSDLDVAADATAATIRPPAAADLLAAAADAMAGLEHLVELAPEEVAGPDYEQLEVPGPDLGIVRRSADARWASEADPVRTAVADVTDLARRAAELRRRRRPLPDAPASSASRRGAAGRARSALARLRR